METEAEKQLAALISMPTLTDDIAANDMALDYLEHYFTLRGMHCQRHRLDGHGTLLASTRPDNAKTPAIMLAAHVDVMAASDAMFTLGRKGDKLIGRGVYDMKFAIAGYMQLVSELKKQLNQYDFAIMITTDEEAAGRDGISGTRSLVEWGCRPRICILPDSTAPGWEVERLAKGCWRFDLTAKGTTAHASRPWEGESASFKLLHTLHDLKQHFIDHGPGTETLNIGTIHGGKTYNQVPDHMVAEVEIRLMSVAAYDTLQSIIAGICKRHDVSFHERALYLPLITDLANPLVTSYMDTVQTITGRRPQGFVSFGGSEAPFFAEHGIPCILSCPAGGRHHSEEEWISRKSFRQFVPILRDYLEKTAKTPAKHIDTATALV